MLLKRTLKFLKRRPQRFKLLKNFSDRSDDKFDLSPEVCYYKTLNVSTSAKFDDIKSAYLKLAKKHHPDISALPNSKQKFEAISNSYKILSKPKTREKYDYSIGIKNPTWQVESEVVDEFENQDLFMKYVKGERDYEKERDNIDLSFEEENTEKLYDYFRYKYLGRFNEKKEGRVRKLSPFRDMVDDANVTINGDPFQFSMKTDKKMREIRKERKERDEYILFDNNTDDAYYEKREVHERNKNIGLLLVKDLKYFVVGLAIFVYFIYTQSFKSRGQDQKRRGRKRIKDGKGVKKKIIPI